MPRVWWAVIRPKSAKAPASAAVMSNFDEKSGLVYSSTPWGQWAQTIEEVFIEVDVAEGTRSRDIVCNILPNSVTLAVNKQGISIKGKLFKTVRTDESVWTLEDRKMIRIVLVKSDRSPANCWLSLLEGQYECDPFVFDKMEKKMTLERFQKENPGFDFSGAEITGNTAKGGPQW